MLVLSRRESETIKIGDEIEITLVRVSGDRVRVGIKAPTNLLILRGELDRNDPPQDQSSTAAA
ncbi:MAG TPA: carbon storage regulator [Pirellulaceae bacterium]|nr:carbon storage regulator [Pirellulaceae bacterium]HMO92569.1 carbon storage regulator [Pirellulaceae bacterium]HMP70633.1 carbon storage regulator [Pirellulaceae bacterium]